MWSKRCATRAPCWAPSAAEDMAPEELMTFSKEIGRALRTGQGDARAGPPAGGQLRRRRHRHPGRCGLDDAARRRWRFCRFRHLQVRRSCSARQGHRRSRDTLQGSVDPGRNQQGPGRAMVGIEVTDLPRRSGWRVAAGERRFLAEVNLNIPCRIHASRCGAEIGR